MLILVLVLKDPLRTICEVLVLVVYIYIYLLVNTHFHKTYKTL